MAALLYKQKLQIEQAILQRGINPNDFKWENRQLPGGDPLPTLSHNETDSYFIFKVSDKWQGVIFYPGDSDGMVGKYDTSDWNSAFIFVLRWLDFVKEEAESKILLEALRGEFEWISLEDDSESDSDTFSEQEISQVNTKLNLIESKLLAIEDITAEQTKFVKQSIKDLRESSSKINRRNWKRLFISFLHEVSINMGASAVQALAIAGAQATGLLPG